MKTRPCVHADVLCLAPMGALAAQQPTAPIDCPLMVREVAALIREHYVFTELASSIPRVLDAPATARALDGAPTTAAFVDTLNALLCTLSHDKHLKLHYEPRLTRAASIVPDSIARRIERDSLIAELSRDNWGFADARILPGNVGMIRITALHGLALAADVMAAAMNFVARSEALVIDLRGNEGGDGDMVGAVLSYLFAEPTQYARGLGRGDKQANQYWTAAYVPGKRLSPRPLRRSQGIDGDGYRPAPRAAAGDSGFRGQSAPAHRGDHQ